MKYRKGEVITKLANLKVQSLHVHLHSQTTSSETNLSGMFLSSSDFGLGHTTTRALCVEGEGGTETNTKLSYLHSF